MAAEQVRRAFLLRSPISGQVYGAANDREQLAASSAMELVEMADLSDLLRVLDARRAGIEAADISTEARSVALKALDGLRLDLGEGPPDGVS